MTAAAARQGTLEDLSTGTGFEEVLLFGTDGPLPGAQIRATLDSITRQQTFKALALREICEGRLSFETYGELLEFLQRLSLQLIRQDGSGSPETGEPDPFAVQEDLACYRKRVAQTMTAYDLKGKPDPSGVYWPNPIRNPASSVFTTLPFIKRLGLITKETPIGSAGSCFAMEIAQSLQARGFNYVVTECEHEDAASGVFVDHYSPNQEFSSFSASYGLLFNTPSFRQLAEKAFGEKELPRLLIPMSKKTTGGREIQVLKDPYRENVFFYSHEHYLANYEKHIAAVREAFLTAEYFVITPGLNECWEYAPDGSVISRNPNRDDFYPLLRRRVLTMEENVWNLQRMIDIVRHHNPDFKVIISLSPVPFLATTRGDEQHVICANAHSKAVLRVAIEEVVKANRGVHYFPSYELVTVCSEAPWDPDQRHVNRPTIERVMELFEAMFVS